MELQVGDNEVLLCVDPAYYCDGGDGEGGREGRSSELSLLQQVSKFKPLTDWLGSFPLSECHHRKEDGGEIERITLSKITVRNVHWISNRIATVVADAELSVKTTAAVDPRAGKGRQQKLSKITQPVTLIDPTMTASSTGSSLSPSSSSPPSSCSTPASAKAILLPVIISGGEAYGVFCQRRDRITKERRGGAAEAAADSIDAEAFVGSVGGDGRFSFEHSLAPFATAALRAAGFDTSDGGLTVGTSLAPLLPPAPQPGALIFADCLPACTAYSVSRVASPAELDDIASEVNSSVNGTAPGTHLFTSVQIVPLCEVIKKGNDLKAVTAASLAVTEIASAGTA